MKSNNIKGEWWFYVLVWCLSVWGQLFLILSLVRVMGWNMSPTMIVITILVVPLIDAIVGYMLYKKREGERLKRYFYKQSQAIKEDVAKILSLGGVCAQTDADGWREYKLIEWKYKPKCYVKNVDGCKTLVICPIESAISVEQMVIVHRIVTEQKVGVLNADVVVASDLRGYIELCLDMSDIIFAQPYYHCISLGVASTYIPVMNFLKGRESIDNNADTTTDSENMEDVVFRKEDILY